MGYPLPSQVKAGVIFGPANEFVGTGETVFASQFCVQIEHPSLTISQRAKRQAPETQVVSPPIRQSKSPKSVAVFSVVPSAVAFTAPDEITVLQRTESAVATTRLDSATIARKPVASAINYDYQSINIIN